MHEAKYYRLLKDKVECRLCPHQCKISEGKAGICRVRRNMKGELYSMVYGKSVAANADPIEKKPLFHFKPGSRSFSFGTVGCNLRCEHCQNADTSQAKPEDYPGQELLPDRIVDLAIEFGCESISATYNEPTVFFEYMLDTFKLAKERGLKTVMVTNGFMNPRPAEELQPYLDALNIDLKSFDDRFYREISGAKLQPVLDSIKFWHRKAWLEVTNLIIPTLNDDLGEIRKMCVWIVKNLDREVPLHFSAFHPCYRMMDKPSTTPEVLFQAYDIAKEAGLKHVYTGNIIAGDREDTYCPQCKEKVIDRQRYLVGETDIVHGKCRHCGAKVAGVWD
ncbi:MAG: AmmeMemoRadiSam system radical SAM enzyme [Nanoarchaeota archaeon]|nr:AmmeMemoRadiSam system radical SAM enzyme [Nanoarchaeota archaeon]